jgi:hypothetical protein
MSPFLDVYEDTYEQIIRKLRIDEAIGELSATLLKTRDCSLTRLFLQTNSGSLVKIRRRKACWRPSRSWHALLNYRSLGMKSLNPRKRSFFLSQNFVEKNLVSARCE